MSLPVAQLRERLLGLRKVQLAKLVVFPSVTGALTGAACIGFVESIELVQWLAIGSRDLPLRVLPGLAWYHVLLVPVMGGLIVGPLVRLLAPEAEGHGVPEVIEAVTLGGGRIRRRIALVKAVASAVTIGTGGSVGREGPIVQIGAAIGSAVGQLFRMPAERLKTLAACGAAGGIAAVFNAPIAGAFFALEVITGNFAMPAFSPVVLSSVIATVISRAYFGDHPAFVVQPYEMESAVEIAVYAGLGVACAGVGVLFVSTMDWCEKLAARVRVAKIWLPACGGAVLGVMILAVPNLYGVGYATMDAALAGRLSWPMLALLIPLKILATSVTLASGGSGGMFLPALYVGALTGGLYGTAAHALLPAATAGPGAYALVGMAGVLAASTHSPITAILLLLEVTGDYKIILPVMIVATLGTLVGRALKEDSLYTLSLSRRGIALHRREDLILRSHRVAEVMRPATRVIGDHTSLEDTIQYFLDHEAASAYVTDAHGRFVGAISIHDIKDPSIRDLGPLLVARDIAEPNIYMVSPEDTLAACMEQLVLSEDEELPVVSRDGQLLGVVSRRDVLSLYSTELLQHEYLGVVPEAPPEKEARLIRVGGGFTVARVPVPEWLVGSSLRDANLRARFRLTVVAIRSRRDAEDRLPNPDERLRSGDELVVVGTPENVQRFAALPEAPGAALASAAAGDHRS